MKGLLDTSYFIAVEQGRDIEMDALPDTLSVSVVTVAELELGVLAADDQRTRSRRLGTLNSVRESFATLPIDAEVASRYAEVALGFRIAGRRLDIQDAWIAATALVHSAAVVTQDSDFDGIPGLDVVRV